MLNSARKRADTTNKSHRQPEQSETWHKIIFISGRWTFIDNLTILILTFPIRSLRFSGLYRSTDFSCPE
ncbi:hypothetical protein KL86APRO_10463 [uncultured Alphaproteobacteria bacterium]|uniref:Uncharacterized protein n=1 Tax=uncultured Alphaproteobacteria bacterium TaxID=91750 RepID=A0A212J3T8_9PROT|nr:hypothetical protein KL86APRO_10463 [uncultured Alphaproteobacteria bacterium]